MKIISLAFSILVLSLAACASRSDGTGSPPPECGDGTCDPGETHASCPSDCTETVSCNGDGVCDAGEDAASCPDDCVGDLYPDGDYHKWVCYPSRRGGKYYWSCNPDMLFGAPDTAKFVGSCRPLGLTSYWTTGDYLDVAQDGNGEYTAEIDNTQAGVICEMTYAICPDRWDSECWAQYGEGNIDSSIAPYRQCGQRTDSNGNVVWACGQFFKIVPGQLPVPIDSYPATPPQ